jgi:hypothetical protein
MRTYVGIELEIGQLLAMKMFSEQAEAALVAETLERIVSSLPFRNFI